MVTFLCECLRISVQGKKCAESWLIYSRDQKACDFPNLFSTHGEASFARGTWEKACTSLKKPLYLSDTLFDPLFNVDVSASFLPLREKGLKTIVSDGPKKQNRTFSFSWSGGVKLDMCAKENEKCLLFSVGWKMMYVPGVNLPPQN